MNNNFFQLFTKSINSVRIKQLVSKSEHLNNAH